MGLPSGLIWASWNVGSRGIDDYGLFFSWGNTDGHAADSGYIFSQSVYDGTPAAAIGADLTLDQDAARVILGAPWRMPSAAEFEELYNNCTYEWTSINGVRGYLFTSNLNGNQLFFPAAGFFNSSQWNNRGSRGYYWASTYDTVQNAFNLFFTSSAITPNAHNQRRFGFNVRAVFLPVT